MSRMYCPPGFSIRCIFLDEKFTKVGYHNKTMYEKVVKSQNDRGLSVETLLKNCMKRKLNVNQPPGQALGAEVAQ